MYVVVYVGPDASYVLNITSMDQQNSSESHQTAFQECPKVIKETKNEFCVYDGIESTFAVLTYTDANFQTNMDNFRL